MDGENPSSVPPEAQTFNAEQARSEFLNKNKINLTSLKTRLIKVEPVNLKTMLIPSENL